MDKTAEHLDRIIARLIPMEIERLTGWKGPPGAAYNVISEDLANDGLLNHDWSLSLRGKDVVNRIKELDAIAAMGSDMGESR